MKCKLEKKGSIWLLVPTGQNLWWRRRHGNSQESIAEGTERLITFVSTQEAENRNGSKVSRDILPPARLHLLKIHNIPKHGYQPRTKYSNTGACEGHYSFKPPQHSTPKAKREGKASSEGRKLQCDSWSQQETDGPFRSAETEGSLHKRNILWVWLQGSLY